MYNIKKKGEIDGIDEPSSIFTLNAQAWRRWPRERAVPPLRPQGGLIPLYEAHGCPCPLPAARRRGELQPRMLAWQGGGQRRRFVPRKEPIKTSGASFSRPDFGRANAWRQGKVGALERRIGHLSNRPSHYGQDRMCTRGLRCGVSRIGCAIYDVFLRPPLSSFFLPPFFRVNFDGANVCTHTNPGLSISADDG